jgi:hypothetical protein
MLSPIVIPTEPVRVTLSDGQWIELKERLNHGEHQQMMERLYLTLENGDLRRQPLKWADVLVTTYLVNWSYTDPSGRPIVIRGISRNDLQSTLDNLDQEIFQEILDAVEAHASRMAAERAEKKTTRRGDGASPRTSPSLVAVTGATNG